LLALGGGPTAGVLALSFAGLIGVRAFGRAEGIRLPARKIDAGMVGAAATIGVSFVGAVFCPGGSNGLGLAWVMGWLACEAVVGAFLVDGD
jgi:hypothetical protein